MRHISVYSYILNIGSNVRLSTQCVDFLFERILNAVRSFLDNYCRFVIVPFPIIFGDFAFLTIRTS